MTKRQRIAAILSVVVLAVLACCTAASMVLYRRLLPQVETVPVAAKEVLLTLEGQGTVKDRAISLALTAEQAAQLPEKPEARVCRDGREYRASVIGLDHGTLELTLPFQLRDLGERETVDVTLLLGGGRYDYVLPSQCLLERNGRPCLFYVEEAEGLTGPELLVLQYPLDRILFTNGVDTAFQPAWPEDLPKEAVFWCDQPLEDGMAAKWRESEIASQ